MKPTSRVASAPAKVILFGEHFVVYGQTAVLAAINMRTTASARILLEEKIVIHSDIGAFAQYGSAVPKDVRGLSDARALLDPIHHAASQVLGARRKAGLELVLKSKIPYGIGLGSSAAACVATIGAVDSLLGYHDKQWICDRAIRSERIIHKNSSGADCYISTFGGIIRYSKQGGYSRITPEKSLRLVVCSTGKRHSTGDMVARVKKFRAENRLLFRKLAAQAGAICDAAVRAIESRDIQRVGHLMTQNQSLLKAIGVSHRKAEILIDLCLVAGAVGAKITGAGGGGAVIALVRSKKESRRVASLVKRAGYESMEVVIDQKGLVVNNSH